MTHATCRLTAKNRDQLRLRNPTPDNRLWATFTFIPTKWRSYRHGHRFWDFTSPRVCNDDGDADGVSYVHTQARIKHLVQPQETAAPRQTRRQRSVGGLLNLTERRPATNTAAVGRQTSQVDV